MSHKLNNSQVFQLQKIIRCFTYLSDLCVSVCVQIARELEFAGFFFILQFTVKTGYQSILLDSKKIIDFFKNIKAQCNYYIQLTLFYFTEIICFHKSVNKNLAHAKLFAISKWHISISSFLGYFHMILHFSLRTGKKI